MKAARGWALALALSIALGIWALFVWQPPLVAGLASALSDRYYSFNTRAPSSEIVFVAVDHAAVKRFGRWPWPRETLADCIARLNQASLIALDMVFSEPTDPSADARLGATLAMTPSVGGFFLNGILPITPDADAMALLTNSALTATPGLSLIESQLIELSVPPILAGTVAQASLNTVADVDERFRHYPVAILYQGLTLPGLGLQTLRLHLNTDAELPHPDARTLALAEHRVHLDTRGFTRLNFYPASAFRQISFADLASPAFDPASLRGKIVLLGVTEAGVSDIRATPLGQYPGALLHATFMSNVLQDHGLREVSPPAMAALLLLLALGCHALSFVPRILPRLGGYLVLALTLHGLGIVLYLHAGFWLESAYLIAAVVLCALSGEGFLLHLSRQQTQMLRGAFASYVPPALVDRIVAQPEQLKLGGEKKEITILFSDIRGFTSLSETLLPEQLSAIMLAYFQPMTEAVFAHGGTLDKYIGDAIMALFNAPLDQPDHALAACRAAAAMQWAQTEINARLRQSGHAELKTGIGINTGQAVVGNLGSRIRFSYTAIGDAVNMASRFESATKVLGEDIVIGEHTWLQVRDILPCRPLGEIALPGKEKPQAVYALCWKEMPRP